MAVTVGTLIVDLQANTASFVSGMDKAGQISLTSMNNIEKAFTSMAATAGAALTAVEGALAALLDQQVNNAARLYDLAQATGVSVEALSGLEYVAKQSGLSTEQLDGALEKMSKSLEKAAAGGANSTNAFKTLGVQITDANGKLLPTTTILESLANKFASFKDGPEKTALAMQIFGKAGADMVPLLNKGAGGIDDLLKEAQRLGIVIGDETAAQAKQFEESMNKVTAAVEGAANSMITQLLPSLQQVINNVATGAEESDSRMKALLAGAAFVGKAFIVAFGAIQTFFDSLREGVQAFETDVVTSFVTIKNASVAALHGQFQEAYNDLKDGNALIAADDKQSRDKQLEIWKEYGAGVVSFWDATVDQVAKKPITGTQEAPTPASKDKGQETFTAMVEKQIIALQSAADKTAMLAAAQKGSSAATIEATAASEANAEIEKLNAEAVDKHVKSLSDKQKAQITEAATEKAFATVANEISKTLADETTKTNETTKSVIDMGAAFSQGATAIQAATDKAKIDPLLQKVQMLRDEFTKLSASGTASSAELQKLAADVANANTQYENAVTALQKLEAAQRATATNEAVTNLDRQSTAAELYTAAVLMGADALRKFNIEQAVLAYTRNPSMDQSTDAVNKYREAVTAAQSADLMKSTAEKIASTANLGNIQDEIDQLNKLRSTVQLNATQELALDAQIHTLELQKQKDMDDLLLKTNSVAAGFKVFFDEYTKDGQTAANAVNTVMKSTVDDFSNTIVNGLTKGKFAFSDFVNSVQAMLLKLALNQLFKSLIGLGLGALNNSSFFSSLGGGSLFGSGGIFGGGHAAGGDVSGGTAYMVGEKGQELFVPKTAGTIIPNDALQHVNASGQPQGGGTNVYQQFNITTPSPDAFRMSQDQITATGLNSALRAAKRNG